MSRRAGPPSRPPAPCRPRPAARPQTWAAACRASSRACAPGSRPTRRRPSPGRRAAPRSSGCSRRTCPSSPSRPRPGAGAGGGGAPESRRRATVRTGGAGGGGQGRRGELSARARRAARPADGQRESTHDAEQQADDDDKTAVSTGARAAHCCVSGLSGRGEERTGCARSMMQRHRPRAPCLQADRARRRGNARRTRDAHQVDAGRIAAAKGRADVRVATAAAGAAAAAGRGRRCPGPEQVGVGRGGRRRCERRRRRRRAGGRRRGLLADGGRHGGWNGCSEGQGRAGAEVKRGR